jgi:hypothetical protein
MNVNTLTMPKAEAEAALQDYAAALTRDGQTSEAQRQIDRALRKGYRALAAGLAVLDLHAVFRDTGLQSSYYPKLAICPADSAWCSVRMDSSGGARFADDAVSWRNRTRAVQIPKETFPTWTWDTRPSKWRSHARALVPLIPPWARPAHALGNYHLIFEAEWEPRPPIDPILVKHLSGALYVVLASWDLTPLERAVLAGRLTS